MKVGAQSFADLIAGVGGDAGPEFLRFGGALWTAIHQRTNVVGRGRASDWAGRNRPILSVGRARITVGLQIARREGARFGTAKLQDLALQPKGIQRIVIKVVTGAVVRIRRRRVVVVVGVVEVDGSAVKVVAVVPIRTRLWKPLISLRVGENTVGKSVEL